MNKPIIAMVAVVIAAGLGVWYYLEQPKMPPAASASAKLQPPAAAPAPPPIKYPLPQSATPSAQTASLPALNHSDAELGGALGELIGAAAVRNYLVPEDLIRHIVATIDNLPRRHLPVQKRPVAAAPGTFMAQGDNEHARLDPQNYARYVPMVEVIRNLDMQKLAGLYFRFYPLFQSAYQHLGYPDGYFNDRLIAVIDVLLAAPQPAAPITLVRPNVLYQFADPQLEARPAGQKLLIRIGPDNAAVVKAKLTELRAALTAAPIRH